MFPTVVATAAEVIGKVLSSSGSFAVLTDKTPFWRERVSSTINDVPDFASASSKPVIELIGCWLGSVLPTNSSCLAALEDTAPNVTFSTLVTLLVSSGNAFTPFCWG